MSTLPASLPAARTPAPREAPALRWGVMGLGGITRQFVRALQDHTGQRVVAAGSSSRERAEAFAAELHLDRGYGSYQALAADSDVDAIWIGSLNPDHVAQALLAIDAGKHVLVTKPFTCTAAEARQVALAARTRGVTCIEGMWTRFLPQSDVMHQCLDAGLIGEVRIVSADHSRALTDVDRLRRADQGGGALLDLGIYPVSFVSSVLGRPERVIARGTRNDEGVDLQTVLALEYAGGEMAAVTTSMAACLPTGADIGGTGGQLSFDQPFYAPNGFTLTAWSRRGSSALRWENETGIERNGGLCYMAAELARCVADGRPESPLLPLDETISIMETLDEARHQVGAYLPGEPR